MIGTPGTPDLMGARREYVAALKAGDRMGATTIALELLDAGVPGEQVLGGLVSRGQVEVGLGWQAATWTVSEEHRASAIALSVMRAVSDAAMRAPGAVPEGSRGPAVVACTEGEWHLLPAQFATETLRLRGFDVTLIGPSVPAWDLAEFLGKDGPSAVAISCSMQVSLAGAWRTISALRGQGVAIVCGGRGFGPRGRWGLALGADVWAKDFSTGADLLTDLLAQPRPGARARLGSPAVRAELDVLRRESEAIVQTATTFALRNSPRLIDDIARVRATREDLASTLQAVESAVVTGDPTVLSSYVTWFEDVLAARQLPVSFVPTALDLLVSAIPADLQLTRQAALDGLRACRGPGLVP